MAGFDPKVIIFFYNFSSPLFNIDIGVSQRLALSPILFALYLTPILHILEKYLKNLKIPVSILSFVDNGLLIAQNKLLTVSNYFLFCSYHVASFFLEKFGLVIEYRKIVQFFISRAHGVILVVYSIKN